MNEAGGKAEMQERYEDVIAAAAEDRRLVEPTVHMSALGNLGRLLQGKGDLVGAEHSGREVLKYDAGNAEGLQFVAGLIEEQDGRGAEAFSMRRKFIKDHRQTDPDSWYSLGRSAELFYSQYDNMTKRVVINNI